MKKNLSSLLLTFVSFAMVLSVKSQVIIDTVVLGPGYANQVWYSLANDNQATVAKNNWDLAFDNSGAGSTILINSVTGISLWQYPTKDTSGWATLDTAGIKNWSMRWNSDTSWSMGAMGRYASANNANDLDWGIYSTVTHVVTGDSLYVIKLANGTYKKLWIRSLASGAYNFRYADLNGSNLQNATYTKANFTGQNFGYYNMTTNASLAREPLSASWDLLFTQFTAFIPTPYTVTGILQNRGVKIAEVKQVNNPSTYAGWGAHPYRTAINTIGYDWKVFTSSYIIEDSLVYFVQSRPGDIWKVIPTGFGGSANGNNIFSKERLSAVSIGETNGKPAATIALYPNPSNGSNVTLLISTEETISTSLVQIFDLTGKLVRSQKLDNVLSTELNAFQLNTNDLENGVYMVNMTIGKSSLNQKLIINK